MLLVTGLMLERPGPEPCARDGRGGAGHRERHPGTPGRAVAAADASGEAQDAVTYSVGAQGSMRARYVDPETGYVTINRVYVE